MHIQNQITREDNTYRLHITSYKHKHAYTIMPFSFLLPLTNTCYSPKTPLDNIYIYIHIYR